MVSWYRMINRKSTVGSKRQPSSRYGERTLLTHVDETTARRVTRLAAGQDATSATMIHEALALLFRQHGLPLPHALTEYLKAHGRPIPPAIRRTPPAQGLN